MIAYTTNGLMFRAIIGNPDTFAKKVSLRIIINFVAKPCCFVANVLNKNCKVNKFD